jgi:hypothetical protein
MPATDIHQRIEWLWNLGREHSREYGLPESALARRRYLAEHPTRILVLKCMDGRIHIPCATNTPVGIIEPFRNLGGMFNLGWPYLGEVVAASVAEAVDQGRRVLLILTYHFSRGDTARGCAGFNHDTGAALRHMQELRGQVEYTFGAGRQTVYPLVLGFETDEDALILHGRDGEMNLALERGADEADLGHRLAALFPDMPGRILADLMPLVLGNIRHISEIRAANRPLAVEHREWMICVGRGFDFLHVPNVALIVGPYSPDLSGPIAKAAGIIRANMAAGRIPDDGFLLLASAPYREGGMDRARAELKARFLSAFAGEVVARELPELVPRMIRETAVLHWETRSLEIIGD